jgi:peptidoglycan hydrolase-like protein with peptidoglycan-binding domain
VLRALLLMVLAVWLVVMPGAASAQTERRVALVVGNASYKSITRLKNPLNDARDVAASLRQLNFQVIEALDASKQDMERKLAEFARLANGADAALVFFSGHALQLGGRNYLIPVDAQIDTELSIEFQTVPIDLPIRLLSAAAGTRILILDACRDNPLADMLEKAGIQADTGLAKMNAGRGMLIAYATQSGAEAYDGTGRNSWFTGAMLQEMKRPGVEIKDVFGRVISAVSEQTKGRQTPEMSVSLTREFYFQRGESDVEAFARIQDKNSPEELNRFAERFPNSPFTPMVRQLAERIREEARLRAEQAQSERARADFAAMADRRNPDELNRFAERFPANPFAAEARLLAQKLREEARQRAQEAARERQAERDRLARAQAERETAERQERERAEAERQRAEAERTRLAAAEREQREQAARELAAQQAAQAERERQARLAAERAERERAEAERDRLARLAAAEKAERERAEAERDRLAAERRERERLAREQAAQAERERQARLAAERAERAERERLAREQAERDRLAIAAERERAEAERQQRLAAERAAREQAAREQAAREQAAREQAAREQQAREQQAREQQAAAERERLARLAAEQAAREAAEREAAAQRSQLALNAAPAAIAPPPAGGARPLPEDEARAFTEEERRKARSRIDATRLQRLEELRQSMDEPAAGLPAPPERSALALHTPAPEAPPATPVALPPVDAGEALIREVQQELARVGCYDGAVTGRMDTATRNAVTRFQQRLGLPRKVIVSMQQRLGASRSLGDVTEELLRTLREQQERVCPPEAETPRARPAPAPRPTQQARRPAREEEDEEDERPVRRVRPQPREAARPPATPAPRPARQAAPATSRPAPAAAAPAAAQAATPRRAPALSGINF